MAKRRKSTRTARSSSRRRIYDPPERISVKFVGVEIDAAIARIKRQAAPLPPRGRIAAKVAIATLRVCRRRIQAAICDGWGAK